MFTFLKSLVRILILALALYVIICVPVDGKPLWMHAKRYWNTWWTQKGKEGLLEEITRAEEKKLEEILEKRGNR